MISNSPAKTAQTLEKKSWLWLSVCTLVVWGFWAFLPKLALQSMQPHSVIFYEAFGNLLVAVPVLLSLRFKMQRDRRAVLITLASSVLTVLAVLFYFYALQTGPVAVIVTMTAMYPVIALVLAATVLKERLNRVQMVAVAMAMLSVLLLAWP